MTREIELLKSASNEIKSLRNQNSLMGARLDMFDKCVMLFTHIPRSTGGVMSPDLTWEIDKFIEGEAQKPAQ